VGPWRRKSSERLAELASVAPWNRLWAVDSDTVTVPGNTALA